MWWSNEYYKIYGIHQRIEAMFEWFYSLFFFFSCFVHLYNVLFARLFVYISFEYWKKKKIEKSFIIKQTKLNQIPWKIQHTIWEPRYIFCLLLFGLYLNCWCVKHSTFRSWRAQFWYGKFGWKAICCNVANVRSYFFLFCFV